MKIQRNLCNSDSYQKIC